jgi:hypothetical protein
MGTYGDMSVCPRSTEQDKRNPIFTRGHATQFVVAQESYVCYTLFVAVFVADFSLLTVIFPTSLFVYGLLAQATSCHFWEVGFGIHKKGKLLQ